MARHVLLALLVAGGVASAQTGAPERSGGFTWAVGNQPGGDADSWEGGDLRATVIEEGNKRRPGPATRADVRVALGANLAPAVREWLQGTFQGQRTARDIHMVEMKQDGTVRRVVTYAASKIAEVQLPALDAQSQERAAIVLKFSPGSLAESTQAPAVSGETTGGRGSSISRSSYALVMDGTQAPGIESISAITARIGADGVPRVSNILLTVVGDAAAAGWKTWFDSYVVQGQNTDAGEKSATLVLSTSTGPALEIRLSGLGIVRVSRTVLVNAATGAASAIRHEVELTCEGLALPPEDASLAPVPLAPEPVKPAPPVPAAAEDQGARDPAGVPRYTECVRTSFTGVRGKTQNEESATYVTKASIEEVDAFFAGKMKDLKWTEGSRIETGRLADLSYKLDVRWEREKQQTAVLILRKRKDGATSIELLVTTQIK